jgi:hypothetical protein
MTSVRRFVTGAGVSRDHATVASFTEEIQDSDLLAELVGRMESCRPTVVSEFSELEKRAPAEQLEPVQSCAIDKKPID